MAHIGGYRAHQLAVAHTEVRSDAAQVSCGPSNFQPSPPTMVVVSLARGRVRRATTKSLSASTVISRPPCAMCRTTSLAVNSGSKSRAVRNLWQLLLPSDGGGLNVSPMAIKLPSKTCSNWAAPKVPLWSSPAAWNTFHKLRSNCSSAASVQPSARRHKLMQSRALSSGSEKAQAIRSSMATCKPICWSRSATCDTSYSAMNCMRVQSEPLSLPLQKTSATSLLSAWPPRGWTYLPNFASLR
mmetsp:Transcript_75910/g.217331  ORF Transcript_75910/g.217331 Transcript_75910/m.217331 type:complete len:242 (-) Transcript_75910:720-1445(-)